MSLDNIVSTDRPTHVSEQHTERHKERRADESEASAERPVESDTKSDTVVSTTSEADESSKTGSLVLGKQRSNEQVISTEPEKHLTPRATSKEFVFPKSN